MEHEAASGLATLIWPTINLLILLGILFHYTRKPVSDFVSQRHLTLREELDRVREQLRIAQEKYREFTTRLQALDSEVRTIREQLKQDGQNTKTRIVTEARRASELIISDAKSSSQALVQELKQQLYTELSSRVLDRAEKLLRERLTGDDRARIRQEFSKQLETSSA